MACIKFIVTAFPTCNFFENTYINQKVKCYVFLTVAEQGCQFRWGLFTDKKKFLW